MDDGKYYELQAYGSMTQTKIDWLWYPYIPYGSVTIVQGDPGEGKSTMMLRLVALLTSGRKMPDGSGEGKARNVVYQAAEDGVSNVILPRLLDAGADCNKVMRILPKDDWLSLDDSRFERAIRDIDAALLVIDPLQAFLTGDTDMQRANSVRSVMNGLSKIAEETNCAVVLIGHLNKNSGSRPIYRGLGSIDFAAAARSILVVERDAEDPQVRIIRQIKSSFAPAGKGYMFELSEENGFQWLGEIGECGGVEAGTYVPKKSKKDLAKQYISELLSDGDRASTEILNYIQRKGIGIRTAKQAKAEMNIDSYKDGNIWLWHLNEE